MPATYSAPRTIVLSFIVSRVSRPGFDSAPNSTEVGSRFRILTSVPWPVWDRSIPPPWITSLSWTVKLPDTTVSPLTESVPLTCTCSSSRAVENDKIPGRCLVPIWKAGSSCSGICITVLVFITMGSIPGPFSPPANTTSPCRVVLPTISISGATRTPGLLAVDSIVRALARVRMTLPLNGWYQSDSMLPSNPAVNCSKAGTEELLTREKVFFVTVSISNSWPLRIFK